VEFGLIDYHVAHILIIADWIRAIAGSVMIFFDVTNISLWVMLAIVVVIGRM